MARCVAETRGLGETLVQRHFWEEKGEEGEGGRKGGREGGKEGGREIWSKTLSGLNLALWP